MYNTVKIYWKNWTKNLRFRLYIRLYTPVYMRKVI